MINLYHTPKDMDRAEAWIKANKSDFENSDECAHTCARHFGLLEDDYDGNYELKEFTPIWMLEMAEKIFKE